MPQEAKKSLTKKSGTGTGTGRGTGCWGVEK